MLVSLQRQVSGQHLAALIFSTMVWAALLHSSHGMKEDMQLYHLVNTVAASDQYLYIGTP